MYRPGKQYCNVMMVWVVVIFEVNFLLEFTEALQGLVCVMRYNKFFLHEEINNNNFNEMLEYKIFP